MCAIRFLYSGSCIGNEGEARTLVAHALFSKVLARTLILRVSWVPKAKYIVDALARDFALRQLSRWFLSC